MHYIVQTVWPQKGHIWYEPRREKTGLRGFRPGPTQTGLYSLRSRLEAWNFGFKKKRNSTIRVAKTKALISFAVTMKLICVFVFACANCWFSHEAAQILLLQKYFRIIHFFMSIHHIHNLYFYKKWTNICTTLFKQYNLKKDIYDMSRDARKPVFGVSDQVRHKPACTVSEAG